MVAGKVGCLSWVELIRAKYAGQTSTGCISLIPLILRVHCIEITAAPKR